MSKFEEREVTSVDDIRRVRERLSAEFDNDVDRLAEHARKVAENYREKLGFKRVMPPNQDLQQTCLVRRRPGGA